jgi:hypothetical protein
LDPEIVVNTDAVSALFILDPEVVVNTDAVSALFILDPEVVVNTDAVTLQLYSISATKQNKNKKLLFNKLANARNKTS